MASERVLIVEDEPKTAHTVELYLKHAGYATEIEPDGRRALARVRADPPALIVLDRMLPGVDGLSICRAVRAESKTPIIMLTARTSEGDRIDGLDAGADDYVAKPFSPRELVARVRAVLRRSKSVDDAGPARLQAGDLTIDRSGHEVRLKGRVVSLTPSEYRILEILVLSPGRTFSRSQLADRLAGPGPASLDRTIDAHVTNLRAKLEADRSRPRYIVTMFGVGYRFAGDRDAG